MPDARIFVSASYQACSEAAANWIASRLGASEVVVVGGTRAAADEFARSLPGRGAVGVHRFSLLQLAAAIGGPPVAELGLVPLSPMAAEAVAARATYELFRDKQLRYFAGVAAMPGFPGALASTLSDLRLARVGPNELPDATPGAGDIIRLYRAYLDELEHRRLADVTTLLETAASVTESPLLGLPLLLLDVPIPSAAHGQFAARLIESSPSVMISAVAGDDGATATYERLAGIASTRPDEHGATSLERVRRHIFLPERPPQGEQDDSVELFAAPGEALESVEIARRIQALAAVGVPFDRMAILLRGPDRYQPFLEEALRRAGVHAWFSRGAARPDSAGRAFLALLACASEHCSASRFAEYLSIGEIPQIDSAGAPVEAEPIFVEAGDELTAAFGGAAPAREPESEAATGPETVLATPIAWERMLVDAAVIGGPERWQRRLHGLENEYRLRIASVESDDQALRVRLSEQLRKLEALEAFALPIVERLGSLPQRASWREWLDHLSSLARISIRHPESILSLLNELEPMAEIGPVELDEVTGVLSERLRFLRREPPKRRYGSVFVGPIEEARGRVFDVVFVPGLAEGLFPQKRFEDPLLLDCLRREIHPALETADRARTDERLLLRIAAAAAKERLVVSYPSMDVAQGRSRVPSFYALEVARAIHGGVPSLAAFEANARARATVKLAWPAPDEPERAIDDIEFDLAWFDRHRNEKGAVAYLTRVSDHVRRALGARYARWERTWRPSDGMVRPDSPALRILAENRLDQRPYSASALQDFAACPYRFYLRTIAHLHEREERAALEQMDPLTRGALFHEAQHLFFASVLQHEPASLDESLEVADRSLDEIEAKYREDLAPAIPRLWHTEIEDLRNDLRGWARYWWRDRADWQPLHSELAFGLPEMDGRDPNSRPDEVELPGGLRVRGAIDLIEKHRIRNVLRITDHKTGKAPQNPPSSVGGGAVLQPVLYGLVVESLLGADVECGRLFFCTQRGAYTEVEIPLSTIARRRMDRVLDTIDDSISRGFLPPAPSEGACGLCDYRSVCGPYEEIRSRRKPRENIEPLNEIRSMP